MRDATGDFGNGVFPGNSVRWVDTGVFNSTSTGVLGTELFWVLGPFSVQAEYAWAFANAAQLPAAGGVPARAIGTPDFNGGYIQLSYFLTGENRIYDRRLGREGSLYHSGPYTPFWFTRAEDGGWSLGRGAWEVAARYNYLNLNDGPVRGGILEGLEVGLNWYLNQNLKIQFEYLHESRDELKTGQFSGHVDALGIRTQIFF